MESKERGEGWMKDGEEGGSKGDREWIEGLERRERGGSEFSSLIH